MVESIPPYNPLDKVHLGESVASALLARSPVALDSLEPFDGAGVYALYYNGRLDVYASVSGGCDHN